MESSTSYSGATDQLAKWLSSDLDQWPHRILCRGSFRRFKALHNLLLLQLDQQQPEIEHRTSTRSTRRIQRRRLPRLQQLQDPASTSAQLSNKLCGLYWIITAQRFQCFYGQQKATLWNAQRSTLCIMTHSSSTWFVQGKRSTEDGEARVHRLLPSGASTFQPEKWRKSASSIPRSTVSVPRGDCTSISTCHTNLRGIYACGLQQASGTSSSTKAEYFSLFKWAC